MSTITLNEQSSTVNSLKDEADIRALIESVHKAHHGKNAAAIAAAYAQDAAIFSLAPPLSHRGMDLEKKKAWLDTWEGPSIVSRAISAITVCGHFAFCPGFYRLSGTPKAAPQPVTFWMRATVCLSRSGSSWLIDHEHTSVRFYMDGSLRPAFDLKP